MERYFDNFTTFEWAFLLVLNVGNNIRKYVYSYLTRSEQQQKQDLIRQTKPKPKHRTKPMTEEAVAQSK